MIIKEANKVDALFIDDISPGDVFIAESDISKVDKNYYMKLSDSVWFRDMFGDSTFNAVNIKDGSVLLFDPTTIIVKIDAYLYV